MCALFVAVVAAAADRLESGSGELLQGSGDSIATQSDVVIDGRAAGSGAVAPGPAFPWADPPIDLTSMATASGSSTWNAAHFAPAEALDGVWGGSSDLFISARGDYEPRLTLDMGEIVSLDSIRIYNRFSCCRDRFRDLVVVVTNDPPSGHSLESLRDGPTAIYLAGHQPGDYVDVDLNSWTGRYVSIYRTYAGGETPYLQISETIVTGWQVDA